MKEKVKVIIKGSLALLLALSMVVSGGVWMKDAQLLADEAAPEAAVVVEEAAPAELPVPAAEPVVVVQEVTLPAEEPAENEPAVRSPEAVEVAAAEPVADAQTQDAEPAEQAESPAEAEPAEEPAEQETASAESEAPFNVREAYEYYMSLGSDEEKLLYLESLDPADREALKQYIALKEAELQAAQAATAEPAAEDEEAVADDEWQVAEDDVLDAPEQEDAETDAEESEPDEEPEVEAPSTSFASASVSGEWSGRDTKQTRHLSVEVYLDGQLKDSCSTEMNMSVASFSLALGGCTVESASSTSYGFSGSNGSYTVDMYADNYATVTVNLASPAEDPEAPDEEAAEESEPFNPEAAYAELQELDEEAKAAYLAALSEEDAAALEAYILSLEEEDDEYYDIAISVLYEGDLTYGTIVTMKGDVLDFEDDDDYEYVWEVTSDGGATWQVVEGVTGLEYTFEVTPENAANLWRVSFA